jgi:transcription elongation factor GreA
MEAIHITPEGLEKLKKELEEARLQTRAIANQIETARAFGDLKENAEYHAAKEAQGMNSARIRDLESKIARSVLLDEDKFDNDSIRIGATVRVLNKKTNKEVTWTLVSPVEADMATGKISVRSPVGTALLGKTVGEQTVAKVPAGDLPLEVLEISRS